MAPQVARRRTRAPDATRERLLRAAFEEIHRHGFQAASLDAILARAGVTKGALYHHFADKAALGHAMLDEVVTGLLLQRWLGRLQQSEADPLTTLQGIFRERAERLTPQEVELGCPLNNLAQEMSPLDEQFRGRINGTFDTWTEAFARALERGQADGSVRRDLDARRVAAFLVAAIEGSIGLAKSAKSAPMLRSNLEMLAVFLESLRPASAMGKLQ
jgi:TetR/AcrR family transcriptional repressor of nem operon